MLRYVPEATSPKVNVELMLHTYLNQKKQIYQCVILLNVLQAFTLKC